MAEQDTTKAGLTRTAALLPAAQGEGVKQIADLAPAVSENLTKQFLAELGSQALAEDMPTKAAEMKRLGAKTPSVADSLMQAIGEAKKDPTKKATLAKAVASVSGLSEADAGKALDSGDDAKLKASIEKTMGDAMAKTAKERAEDVYLRYELETTTPAAKPAATAEQTAAIAEIKGKLADIPDRYISADQKKAAVTILEAAPDHAQEALEKIKARDKDGAIQVVANAAVDASIRSDGNDQPIVDALATIQSKKPEEVRKDLHADAARKIDAANPMGSDEEEQKKKAEREKDGGGNFLSNMLKEPGGMMMMLIIAVIAMVSGHGEMLGQLFGGGDGKDGKGAGEKGTGGNPRVVESEGVAYAFTNAEKTHADPREYAQFLVTGKDGKSHFVSKEVELSKADAAKIDAYAASHHLTTGDAITAMSKEDAAKNGKSDPVTMLSHYNEKGELKGQAAATAQGQQQGNTPAKSVSTDAPTLTDGEKRQLVADVTGDTKVLAGGDAMKAALEAYGKSHNIKAVQDDKGAISPDAMKDMLDRFAAEKGIDMGKVQAKLDAEIAARGAAPATPAAQTERVAQR